jgi:NAD(P)-dependent dehydrogenase (short-subunit alcohol dehydrogenase family)
MQDFRIAHARSVGSFGAMTVARTALITGANQGLGRALAEGLAPGMAPQDRVLVTGRDAGRVEEAARDIAAGPAVARVEGRVLDVRDGDAIGALAAQLGEVDIVFSNATARMSPAADPADEVDAVADTSNVATSRILRAFAPRLRPGGRLIIVASALGTLDKLDERITDRFAQAAENLDAVDALVADWRASVLAGRAEQDGFGTWLNIPSKVAQVAAVRAVARERRAADLAANRLIMALCPGLVDTDASRPWFDDMSAAQSPAEAASWPVELALSASFDPAFYGELVQFGRVIPWETGVPVAHSATARRTLLLRKGRDLCNDSDETPPRSSPEVQASQTPEEATFSTGRSAAMAPAARRRRLQRGRERRSPRGPRATARLRLPARHGAARARIDSELLRHGVDDALVVGHLEADRVDTRPAVAPLHRRALRVVERTVAVEVPCEADDVPIRVDGR